MKKSIRIIVVCILVLLLEGCISVQTGRWTAVNMGGVLNNLEMERPCKQQTQSEDGRWHFRTRAWKKGDRYIVEVPVAYVPFNPPIIEHSTGHSMIRKTLDNEYWGPRNEEIAQYPTELYYADVSKRQFQHLCILRKVDMFRDPFPQLRLIHGNEVDFNDTTLIYESDGMGSVFRHEEMEQFHGAPHLEIIRTGSLPPRRSTLNYCLQPVRWLAEVADIPLSIIATPIGWLVDAIYEPLNN